MSKTRDLANLADLNFDSGTMVVDKANDRVGVGTASPSHLLHLSSGASSAQGIKIENSSGSTNGDATVQFTTPSLTTTIGIDATSTDLFKISNSSALGTSDVLTIDSSQNLLVGKTSSNYQTVGVEAKGNGSLWATADGNGPLVVTRKTSDGTLADFYKDTTKVGSIGVDSSTRLYFTNNTGAGLFLSDGTQVEPMNNGSRADATMNLGGSTYRFKDLYLSGGVYLGGTGAANYLDDYEEGTWTPVWVRSSSNPSWSSATQIGYYTKVGNLVTITWYFETNAITSNGSGAWRIGGLPFTVSGDSYASIGRFYNSGDVTGMRAYGIGGNTLINYMIVSTDSNYAGIPGGYTILQGTLSYFT